LRGHLHGDLVTLFESEFGSLPYQRVTAGWHQL
jgi:hypothetical protein